MSRRDEFIESMKSQLDEWNEDIDGLEAKLKEMSEPVRAKLEPQFLKVQEGYAGAKTKLAEIKTSGEESWEGMTDDAERVWKALGHSINYFKSQVKRPDGK